MNKMTEAQKAGVDSIQKVLDRAIELIYDDKNDEVTVSEIRAQLVKEFGEDGVCRLYGFLSAMRGAIAP